MSRARGTQNPACSNPVSSPPAPEKRLNTGIFPCGYCRTATGRSSSRPSLFARGGFHIIELVFATGGLFPPILVRWHTVRPGPRAYRLTTNVNSLRRPKILLRYLPHENQFEVHTYCCKLDRVWVGASRKDAENSARGSTFDPQTRDGWVVTGLSHSDGIRAFPRVLQVQRFLS